MMYTRVIVMLNILFVKMIYIKKDTPNKSKYTFYKMYVLFGITVTCIADVYAILIY